MRPFDNFGKKVIDLFHRRPGLVLLICLLIPITFGIVKPDFFLIGWDNFSSYLNPSNNLWNTLFSAWREHRGLGVPSDAEINDIFRQLFCLLISFFGGKKIADQLYMVFMLWGGILGMYVLGRYISRYLHQTPKKQEFFGFVAGFFYLFNLSTLAVFYFPMIMYNTRFFMLPTSVLIIFRLINDRQISFRRYLFYGLLLFVGFGAYMVPTIFIVFMIFLGLLFFFAKRKKRVALAILFFVGLNLYWLLPFTNYTVQKSKIVPQAPTFVEINESMINKPKSYYSFEKQAKLRPSFFESQFTNNETRLSQGFHELASLDQKGLARLILWVFPITYLSGIVYIFLFQRKRILLWFASTALIFLILSMKEYSPFGAIYGFISDHIPFANTIFRFGDTKFHAMIAFSGSVISAYLLTQILTKVRRARKPPIKYLSYLSLACLLIVHLVIYKSYFTGNFIGFFMYNKIPSAYFDMAETINKDTEAIRVIHLPIDTHGYWKPYTWGYFGSSFLHFMINKPLFDRTFEPASAENADIHRQIIKILNMVSTVPEEERLSDRAHRLYELMRSLSVKYIIDDGSISTNIDARNISYWGTINYFDSGRLLGYMEKEGLLRTVKQYEISGKEYAADYAKLYPYNKKLTDGDYPNRKIKLYQLTDTALRIELLTEVDKVVSQQGYLPPNIKKTLDNHYIQSTEYDNQALVYPFVNAKNKVLIEKNIMKISDPVKLASGTYTIESKNASGAEKSYMINVYAKTGDKTVTVYLENPILPNPNNASSLTDNNLVYVELKPETNDYSYLSFGDTVMPIENTRDGQTKYLGSAIVRNSPQTVGLLHEKNLYDVSRNLTQLEPNPQCFNDALENPVSKINGDNQTITIAGQNVSNCLTTSLSVDTEKMFYGLLEFEVVGLNDNIPTDKTVDTGKPLLKQHLDSLKSPLILYVCLKFDGSTTCSNKQLLYRVSEKGGKYAVPVDGNNSGVKNFLITYAVRNNQKQKYEVRISNIKFKTYVPDKLEKIDITAPSQLKKEFYLKNPASIDFVIPIAKSPYTNLVDTNEDGILTGNDPSCKQTDKYELTKQTENGLLEYVIGCKNYINKNIAFSSDNYYVWQVDYKHFAGSIPAMVIMDKLNTYNYEKLNPPDIEANNYFSVAFQKPETIFSDTDRIKDTIKQTTTYAINGYVEPQPDLKNNNNKEFIIDHYSQNEGLIEVDNMSLVELPNYWLDSQIRPSNYRPLRFNDNYRTLSFERILPSLWRVDLDTDGGEYLLHFNEQYDNQWLVLNAQTLSHTVCDGYTNCYKIALPKGNATLYIFYAPEILSWTGIFATLIATIGGLIMLYNQKYG